MSAAEYANKRGDRWLSQCLREDAQYLRDGCDNVGHSAEMADRLEAAADEIERLRAALSLIEEHSPCSLPIGSVLSKHTTFCARHIARGALHGD